MKRIAFALLLSSLLGCSDRLSPGDWVILADPDGEKVLVKNMDEHVPEDASGRAMQEIGVQSTSEFVNNGTRATVISDKEVDNSSRSVKIQLSDGYYRDHKGEVARSYLKAE